MMQAYAENTHSFEIPYNTFFLNSVGFHFIDGRNLKTELELSENELSQFQKQWDGLKADNYMADGGSYRLRRFGSYHYTSENGLTFIGNQTFFQNKNHNQLNGGVERLFAPLESEFQSNTLLLSLIKHDISLLPAEIKNKKLKIFVHQIRILADQDFQGMPTPEGIHQDGHLFVAQHLIKRQGISGGESCIYDLSKRSIYKNTLTHSLDTLIVNDPQVFHSVSAIKSENEMGFRDMLLIDINLLEEV